MLVQVLLFVAFVMVLPLALYSLDWLLPFRVIQTSASISLLMLAGWTMVASARGTKLSLGEFLVSITAFLPLGGGIVISEFLFPMHAGATFDKIQFQGMCFATMGICIVLWGIWLIGAYFGLRGSEWDEAC